MNSSYASPSGCEASGLLGGRLQQPSPVATAALIFLIIIHIVTFPFTAVLNALVMNAVKVKSRLRAHKSYILLALLASTDFIVGVIVQPTFIAVLVMFLLDEPRGYCVLRVVAPVMSCLINASLFHLALISGKRYFAMKHPITYTTMVAEARLLVASALAWLLLPILHIPLAAFAVRVNTVVSITIAFTVFCHVTVYRETRRHEQKLAAQQVKKEAREQLQKDKKALKLTSTILAVLVVCFLSLVVCRTILMSRYWSKMSLETVHIVFSFVTSIVLLNSLLYPIIYTVKMRQFRIAFIEFTCRTVHITEAEEIEMRVFGTENVVVRLEAGQEHERLDQRNGEQANGNNSDLQRNDLLPQHENHVVEQPNNNHHLPRSVSS